MHDANYGERKLIVNGRTLSYSGIFHVSELFSTLNSALLEKGYDLREKKSEEVVTETGRNLFVELRPMKTLTDYVAVTIKIKVRLKNMTTQIQELEGRTFAFDRGDVEIVFDSWVYTDYEGRWSSNALTVFLTAFIHKWIVSLPRMGLGQGEAGADTGHVYGAVRNLLSSYRRRDSSYVSDLEVRKQIEEEIQEAQEMPESEVVNVNEADN